MFYRKYSFENIIGVVWGAPYLFNTDYLQETYCPGAGYDLLLTPVAFEDSVRVGLAFFNWDGTFATEIDTTLVSAFKQFGIRGSLPMSNKDTVEIDIVIQSHILGEIIEADNFLAVHYLDYCE